MGLLNINAESTTIKQSNTFDSEYNNNIDGFAQIFSEAANFLNDQGVHFIQNSDELYASDSLFDSFSQKLMEGALPEDTEQIQAMFDNHRLGVLKESQLANIEPVSSLTMPHIRKTWYKTCIRDIYPTEVATLPVFGINLLRPYLQDDNGDRHYLPESLNANNWENLIGKVKLYSDWIPVSAPEDTTDANYEFFADGSFNIMNASGGSKQLSDTLTSILKIVEVEVQTDDMDTPVTTKVNIENNISDNIFGFVDFVNPKDNKVYREQIFGNVDRNEGTITITCLKGYLKRYKVLGYLSSENNRRGPSVSFDNYHKDIKIEQGPHMHAPLGIEWIQDNYALYKIDAAAELVDLMSEVFSQTLDYEGFKYLYDVFQENEMKLFEKWSCKPPSYASGLTPSDWKEELKQVIERVATQLKSLYKFTDGSFIIFGNPLDILQLQNIDWSFNHGSGNRASVNVNYDIGAYTINNSYKIISAETVPSGFLDMIMVPNPSNNNYMTWKYYPYTYNVIKDNSYRNPHGELVPSIMMTKRHKFEHLVPIHARIKIENNDSSMYSSWT